MSAVDDAADRAVASVKDAYARLVADSEPHWYSYQSDAQKQTWGDVQTLKPQIDAWATTYRRWAEQGQRDDGSAFSWSMWADLAKTYANTIQAFGAYYVDGSTLNAVIDASMQTVSDAAGKVGGFLQTVGNLALSPWVWWVGGGVVVLLAVGPFVAPLLRRAKP